MRKIELIVSSLALLCLLAYTGNHTGQLLSTYITPSYFGFIAAIGIETAVISLSMRIGTLRRDGVNTVFFLLTLIAVVIVSAIANMVQGHMTMYGTTLTWQSIHLIDAIEAGSWFAANGLISLITMALAEVIGSQLNQSVTNPTEDKLILIHSDNNDNKLERKRTKTTPKVNETVDNTPKTVPEVKALSDGAIKVQQILSSNPDASKTDIANVLKMSRPTVYRHLKELETITTSTNGHGK